MRRRIVWIGAAVFAVALAAIWVGWVVPTRAAVHVGAGMLAKQMCSCIHVAGRSAEACRGDQLPVLDPIEVDFVSSPHSVRAFVPLLGERVAVHHPGFGCRIE